MSQSGLHSVVFSIETIFFVLLIAFLFFFLFVLPRKQEKDSAKLVAHFQGTSLWPLGTVELNFKSSKFWISRLARGGGVGVQTNGSYPVLWTYVDPCPKLIVGHLDSKRFTRGQFLILPPHEQLQIGSRTFLIGSDQTKTIEDLRSWSDSEPLAAAFSLLFSKPFHHVTISTEIHILGFKPQRKCVLRYTCLPEAIYEDPSQLETYFEALQTIQLNLKPLQKI